MRLRRRYTIGWMLVVVLVAAGWSLIARSLAAANVPWQSAAAALAATAIFLVCVEGMRLTEYATIAAIGAVLAALLLPPVVTKCRRGMPPVAAPAAPVPLPPPAPDAETGGPPADASPEAVGDPAGSDGSGGAAPAG
jgi:hypothetical protein